MSSPIEYVSRSTVPDPENYACAKCPTLYKKSLNGKIRIWEARVILDKGDVYYQSRSGYKGGVITENVTRVYQTKLLSAREKAKSKLSSAVNSKLDNGYYLNEEDAKNYVPTKPMLLHKWDDHGHKLSYPVFVLPKLDGVCGLYRDDPSNPRIDSRENNEFLKLKPMAQNIKSYLDEKHGVPRIRMNIHVEIYAHGRHVSEIVEAIKGDNEEVFNELKLYSHDYIFEKGDTYHYRLKNGGKFIDWGSPKCPVVPIQVKVARSRQEVEGHYEAFLKQNFEGAVICKPAGVYTYETRSYDKLKKKQLLTDEFEVVGFEAEINGDDSLIIFKLKTTEGVTFKARPAWKHERRKEAYDKGESFVGEMATVEYRRFTKYNTPFHAVLVAVRDYE